MKSVGGWEAVVYAFRLRLVNEQRSIKVKNQIIQSGILTALALVLVNGITGVASGAVLYQDNFDNVTVGDSPSPQVGTHVGGQALVGDSLATPPSTPNYLDSFREQDEDFYGDLAGAPLAPGASVHVEMAIYAIDGFPVIGLNSTLNFLNPHIPAGDGILFVSGSPGGATVFALDSTGALQATGLTHSMNTWEIWEIDYVVGASSYDLTIAGNTVNLGSGFILDSAATQLEGVLTFTFSGSTHFLIDDVLVEGPFVPDLVPGDFDGDGDVDGADFVVWQTHFPTATGATLADGDADGDGDVDGADFVVWQTNFPFTPGGATSPVPEPGSMILISLGGIIVLARSWLRK